MAESFQQIIEKSAKTQKILWGAFTFTIFLYSGVAFVVASKMSGPVDEDLVRLVRLILVGVSAACAVGATLYRRRAFSEAGLRRLLDRAVDLRKLASSRQGRNGPLVLDPARLASLQAMEPADQKLVGLVQGTQVTLIISLGLQEVIAVFGLVLAFVSRAGNAVLPFAAVALILNVFAFPDPTALVERARRLLGPDR